MRIAFIMLCHKDPEQVNMLVRKLSEFREADVYIHVDGNHAQVREGIEQRDNVYLIPLERSCYIQWGSVDIVKATLQLIRQVKASGKNYDYIWLVSGQDYPICPVGEIEKRLAAQPGMNYIETIVPGQERYDWYRKLYEMAYPSWINKNSVPIKVIKRLYIAVTGGHRHTFKPFIRRKPFDFDFYFGSQWWTLTADAAYEILAYSDAHPEILTYYEKCIIPDECFFQTLFMRGPYRDQRSMNLTYINWEKIRRSPETLTISDLEKLRKEAETFCFARKFERGESGALIEKLQQTQE